MSKPNAWLKDIPIKAVRKNRRCDWCNEWIHQASPARYRVLVFDGEFQAGYQHPECYEAMCASEFDDWGYTPGEQDRGKTMKESHG